MDEKWALALAVLVGLAGVALVCQTTGARLHGLSLVSAFGKVSGGGPGVGEPRRVLPRSVSVDAAGVLLCRPGAFCPTHSSEGAPAAVFRSPGGPGSTLLAHRAGAPARVFRLPRTRPGPGHDRFECLAEPGASWPGFHLPALARPV